jgi:hypothetical protein
MHRGQQTIPSDRGSCKKVEYKEAADFFSSPANSACYPGGIHISGLVQRWRCPARSQRREAAFCGCVSAPSNLLTVSELQIFTDVDSLRMRPI